MNVNASDTEISRGRPAVNLARITALSALATGLCLGGALSLPFWYALLIRALSSIRDQISPAPFLEVLVNFWQPGVVAAAIIWGLALGRLVGYKPIWRLGIGSGLGVGIGQVVVTTEPFLRFANQIAAGAPLHVHFAIQLTLGMGLAAGLTGLAIGISLLNWRLALILACASGLAAAISALFVDLVLDEIGVRIGTGNAAMAKIVGLAFPTATLSTGAAIGWVLGYFQNRK